MSDEDNDIIFRAGEPEPQKFSDVMIDIETMSLHPHNALILSIGMVEFDPVSTMDCCTIGKQVMLLPSITTQLAIGREVSKTTQAFWKEQPAQARAHWVGYHGERDALDATIDRVREFCKDRERVWANGTQFDLSNLVGLAESAGVPGMLWHYQAPRDMRTFCRETEERRLIPPDLVETMKLVKHDPISDAIIQAWHVWAHYQGPSK